MIDGPGVKNPRPLPDWAARATDVLEQVRGAHQTYARAEQARATARRRLAEAVRQAREAGHSLAEIAEVLGISRQAVLQMSNEGKKR